MKENFPDSLKETDMQVQEAQSSKQDAHKQVHTKTHHIKMPNIKDKERISKAAR